MCTRKLQVVTSRSSAQYGCAIGLWYTPFIVSDEPSKYVSCLHRVLSRYIKQ